MMLCLRENYEVYMFMACDYIDFKYTLPITRLACYTNHNIDNYTNHYHVD